MSVEQSTTMSFSVRASVWSAVLCSVLAALGAGPVAADSIAQGTSQATAVPSKAADVVKESTITTKVKERMAARHYATLATVRVNTDSNGIVWLSGTVSTIDAAALAGQIAKDTEGVVAVHNAIVVQ